MAGYTPSLLVEVEWEGATFKFKAADHAWSRVVEAAGGRDKFDTSAVPPGLIEPLCELFVDGVEAWDGVLKADGNPLPCTREKRQDIPSSDKVQIAGAYLTRMSELEEKKGPSGEPPTSSLPPSDNSGEEGQDGPNSTT